MESVELMSKQIESEAPAEERIPAEISGLLDAVQMLTEKVNNLVAAYAVRTEEHQAEEVEVVEDTTEEVEEVEE